MDGWYVFKGNQPFFLIDLIVVKISAMYNGSIPGMLRNDISLTREPRGIQLRVKDVSLKYIKR